MCEIIFESIIIVVFNIFNKVAGSFAFLIFQILIRSPEHYKSCQSITLHHRNSFDS